MRRGGRADRVGELLGSLLEQHLVTLGELLGTLGVVQRLVAYVKAATGKPCVRLLASARKVRRAAELIACSSPARRAQWVLETDDGAAGWTRSVEPT